VGQVSWVFERGDGRYKHRWSKDEAGFEERDKENIGKCHVSINETVAQALLDTAIPYNAPGSDTVEHLYATYRGVIYEAAPTRPSLSFHGYPWRGNQGRPALPPRILKGLRLQAEQQGYLKEFEQWFNQYSK
jgi:hypothetical protein